MDNLPVASTSDPVPPPISKRKLSHVSKACNGCRRRKRRCDGVQPSCGQCKDKNLCSYDENHDARRIASREYVSALEQKVTALESMLANVGGLDGVNGDLLNDINVNLGALGGPVEDVGDESGLEDAGEAMDRLKIDAETGEIRQYGPTSAFAHLPDPRAIPSPDSRHSSASPSASGFSTSVPRDTYSPRSINQRMEMGSRVSPRSNTGEVDWSRHLPVGSIPGFDQPLHDHLLQLFFSYFNSWCCWTSEELFRRDMDLCLGDTDDAPERTSYYSPLLHNAILSLAVSFSDDPRVHDVEAGLFFASVAKDSIDIEVERPMLSTCQSLMLLGSFYSSSARHGLGWHHAGAGIRMATTLGLGIDCAPWMKKGLITDETRAMREQTFWLCFLQDKLWALYVGRQSSMSSAQIETPLPQIFKSLDDATWNGPSVELPSWTSTTFSWTCKLSLIGEKLMTAIYGPRVNYNSLRIQALASDLHVGLEKWYSDLPPALSISPTSTKPHPSHVICMHAVYWLFSILLHRPFVSRNRIASLSEMGALSLKRCEKAALKIMQLLQLYRTCPGLRYAPISLNHTVFTVGTVYLLLATQTSLNPSSKRVASSFASAQSCVDYLREMPWGCSRQSAAMLSRLIDEWAPPTAVSDVAKDPVSLAQQALDPGSTLAQQLRALGWTPPTAVSGEGAPLAAAAAPVPSTSQAVPASTNVAAGLTPPFSMFDSPPQAYQPSSQPPSNDFASYSSLFAPSQDNFHGAPIVAGAPFSPEGMLALLDGQSTGGWAPAADGSWGGLATDSGLGDDAWLRGFGIGPGM